MSEGQEIPEGVSPKDVSFTGMQKPSSDEVLDVPPMRPLIFDTPDLTYNMPLLPWHETEEERVPLPDKPLAECGVDDLKELTDSQLEELLFKATRYGERTFAAQDITNNIIYTFEVAKPTESDSSQREEIGTNISVGEFRDYEGQDLVGYGYKTVKIKIPYWKGHNYDDFEENVLPIINTQLEEKGASPIPLHSEGSGLILDERDIENYWSSNPHVALEKHNYGDGRIINEYETLPGVLAKEVQDLEALGLDFDDIVNAIDPVVTNLRNSASNFFKEENEEALPSQFYCTDVDEEMVPTIYRHASDNNPDIKGETLQWSYNVITLPFKDITTSTLDHRISHPSQRGFAIPLSETSFSLYKHRIVEGNYLPHYRISAARTAWALEIGTPEQQAKALELDWQNTIHTLHIAETNNDPVWFDLMTTYIKDYFPEDDSPWRKNGFPGYTYDGQQYASLQDMSTDIEERYKRIPGAQSRDKDLFDDIDNYFK